MAGALGLGMTVVNQWQAPSLDPSLERASVLASILSVVLMLVGLLWSRITPEAAERAPLCGEERLLLATDLDTALQRELAWGSALLLTATPAATLLLLWRGRVLLRRGIIPASTSLGTCFQPGPICARALESGRAISLVDLKLYPGREEFVQLLEGLPAVVVQPIGEGGILLLGGWSARCFSRSDLTWLEGWAQRLTAEWVQELDAALEPLAAAPLEPGNG